MEHIIDNAYKIDLLGEYNVSATFNVSDLSPFDVGSNSRTNLFKEGGNDENIGQTQNAEELLQMPVRTITRARAKKFQEAPNGLMKEFIWANPTLEEEFGPSQAFRGIRARKEVQKIINIIKAIDGDHSHKFGN